MAHPVSVSLPGIEAMLGDLPTAHRALPIGRRIAGQGCHGAPTPLATGTAAMPAHGRRIRFVYFPNVDAGDRKALCHRHLVIAEILLERVLAAFAAGKRPVLPALDRAAETRAMVRPPQGTFRPSTLEYRRWHHADGSPRAQPLTREALALRLAADGLSMEEARYRAAHRSHALPAADQAWLIDRRQTPLLQRPLSCAEFHTLARALDGIWQTCAGSSHEEHANRQIAVRSAAMLGMLLDEYVTSPFTIDTLSQAFTERHLEHLRQTIESRCQTESVLLTGPKAWFAAKAARMHAEHQLGLAMAPVDGPVLQLSVRPVVAVVGGKLRTFVNSWRRDFHVAAAAAVATVPALASVG